jgi:hypothetical protein
MLWLPCINLSGVFVGMSPRATMSVAPDDPERRLGFESQFVFEVFRQAGVPLTSSNLERKRSKIDVLAEDGALNQMPENVVDPKFQKGSFFDPHDAVQVKYEMLRRVSVKKASVTSVSDEYGVSRPTFYQARMDFEEGASQG